MVYKNGLGFLYWGPEVPFLEPPNLRTLHKICDFEGTRNCTPSPRNSQIIVSRLIIMLIYMITKVEKLIKEITS